MKNSLHPLLIRQLKRTQIDLESLPANILSLLSAVDTAYKDSDQDRILLERSLELSSKEIYEQNEEMRATLESLPRISTKSNSDNKSLSFSDLLIRHVEELRSSRDSLSKQATLLREQALELALARDVALESSRSKSEFLANMSHEIRTPMNGTLGLLKIVLNSDLKSEQREYLTLAEQSSLELLSVVEDILDFSKIEAGKLDIENIEFKIRHTIKTVLAMVYNQASQKGIDLIAEVDPNIPAKLVSDPNRLKQVLLNLISNAVKFTNVGHVLLSVKSLGQDEKGDSKIRFSVSDTGIGIDTNQQDSVFNAFQQGDGSVTRRFGGTGLGLSISRQLVNLLGGNIALTSKVGVGSEFYFELTLPTTGFYDSSVFLADRFFTQNNYTVVSTNKLVGDILKSQLSALSNGKAKVEFKHPNKIDFHDLALVGTVLLDIGVGLTFETQQMIEGLVKNKVQVIVIVPMFNLSERENILKLGVKSTLLKPFTDSDLVNALRESAEKDNQIINLDFVPSIAKPVKKLKIIVVDDIHVNRLVAKKLLEQIGHDVVCFDGGQQVYHHLRSGNNFDWQNSAPSKDCDLILLDIQMPGIDGIETTQLIRKWEKEMVAINTSHIPIIALTAHALKGDRERFIGSGMDDYLRKPIDLNSLNLMLKRIQLGSSEYDVTPILKKS